MCDRPTPPHPDRRAGFTLIEVLMAAFVIALGVLGLTALFAGAARQQQVSSQTTRSVSASQSANAIISDRFGPIERVDGNSTLSLGDIPRNGQGPDTNVIQNDQWYAVPRSDDGSLSLNPSESTKGWNNDSLFNRAEPRETLPRLLYRAREEKRNGQQIRTGYAGGDLATRSGFGLLVDSQYGAPPLDAVAQQLRELRVIADSVVLRMVVREYPCANSTTNIEERSLSSPIDTEYLLRYQSTDSSTGEFIYKLSSLSPTEVRIISEPKAKDSDLKSSTGDSRLTYAYVEDVATGDPSTACGITPPEYYTVVPDPNNPSDCDTAVGGWSYLWTAASADAYIAAEPSPDTGDPGYSIALGTNPGEQYLYAVMKKVDLCNGAGTLYRNVGVGNGMWVEGVDATTAPLNGIAFSGIVIRKAQFPTKFIYEIWLEDYRYRGHTLASLPETVTYNRAEDAKGTRLPQLGYSMLFRRTSDSLIQYALMTYAITPTYSASADKPDNPDDDFFPREDKDSITSNTAPVRLVKGLDVEFDKDLAQYYIRLTGAAAQTYAWIATPGQTLLFNGDAGRSPPVPGADATVKVVNARKKGANELWAYLDGPPRARLKALPDYGAGNSFDAWVIQSKCEVTQVKPSGKSQPIHNWGLSPVEGRVFTVSQ